MPNPQALAANIPAENPVFAAWVPNYGTRFSGMAEWLEMFEGEVEQAAAAGVQLFLLPEYVSESWMSFCPAERLKPTSDAWQAEQAEQHFFPRVKALAAQHNMVIVAGTVILKDEQGNWRNRAVVFFPDGTTGTQDKVSMMPDERLAVGLVNGEGVQVFSWNGYRFAIIICLDIQIPRIAVRLVEGEGVDFLLVPTMTTHHTGYNRVFTCAAARSVELHCPVLITGGVGTVTARGDEEKNTSGAGIFLPHDTALNAQERQPVIGPFTQLETTQGLLYIARNVPVALCREQRQQGVCEAWHKPNHLLSVEVCA